MLGVGPRQQAVPEQRKLRGGLTGKLLTGAVVDRHCSSFFVPACACLVSFSSRVCVPCELFGASTGGPAFAAAHRAALWSLRTSKPRKNTKHNTTRFGSRLFGTSEWLLTKTRGFCFAFVTSAINPLSITKTPFTTTSLGFTLKTKLRLSSGTQTVVLNVPRSF